MLRRFSAGSRAGRCFSALTLAFFLPFLATSSVPPLAFAQTEDTQRAQNLYDSARFESALETIERALASGAMSGSTLRDAYILRARCQIELGDLAGAEETFCSAIAIDPRWQPDPNFFPRNQINVFDRAQRSCAVQESKPLWKKWWVWAGATLLTGGVVLAVAGGGKDEAGPTPPGILIDFPSHP